MEKIKERITDNICAILENFTRGEINDNIARKSITTQVKDFLELLAEEIYDYEIVCNDTNNPAKMIDENKLLLETYIQYQNGDEYKKYRFEMSREGADFSELNKTEEVNG